MSENDDNKENDDNDDNNDNDDKDDSVYNDYNNKEDSNGNKDNDGNGKQACIIRKKLLNKIQKCLFSSLSCFFASTSIWREKLADRKNMFLQKSPTEMGKYPIWRYQ